MEEINQEIGLNAVLERAPSAPDAQEKDTNVATVA
jgi:hypothetical protein